MEIVNHIKYDLAKRGVLPVIDTVQGEIDSRIIELILFANGSAFDVSGAVCSLAFSKPDGTSGWYDTMPDGSVAYTVSENVLTVKIAPQVLTVPGDVKAVIRIETQSGSDRTTTFPFVISVSEDPAAGATKSENFYNVQTWDDLNSEIDRISPFNVNLIDNGTNIDKPFDEVKNAFESGKVVTLTRADENTVLRYVCFDYFHLEVPVVGDQQTLQFGATSGNLVYTVNVVEFGGSVSVEQEKIFNLESTSGGSVELDTTLTQEGKAADAKAVGDVVAQEEAARKAEVAVERARINQITSLLEGSTTGDAELADIRIAHNGREYVNAGAAVRGQINELRNGYSVFTGADFVQGYMNGDGLVNSSIRIRLKNAVKVKKGDVLSFENTLRYCVWVLADDNITSPTVLSVTDQSIFAATNTSYEIPEDGYLMINMQNSYNWGNSTAITPADFTGEIKLYSTDRITEISDRVDVLGDSVQHLNSVVDGYTGVDFESGSFGAADGQFGGSSRIRLKKAIKAKKGDVLSFENPNNWYFCAWLLADDNLKTPTALKEVSWTMLSTFEATEDCYFYVIAANAATYGAATAITPNDFTGIIHHHKYDPRFERVALAEVPYTNIDFKQGNVDSRYGYVTDTKRLVSSMAIKLKKGEMLQFCDMGGLFWGVTCIQEDSLNGAFTVLNESGWRNEEYYEIPQDCYCVIVLANGSSSGTSTTIVPADFTGYIKHLKYDPRIAELQGETTYPVDIAKIKEFSSLFNGRTDIEPFLFFTDPHLMQTVLSDAPGTRTDWEKDFEQYMDCLERYYNNSPVDNIVCGGDWYDGEVQTEACWKLGRVHSRMRSITDNFHLVVGNHDLNEQGKLTADSERWTGILTEDTISNMWYRSHGKPYYTFETAKTRFFILNSGAEAYVTDNEQYNWFANALAANTADNIVLFFHIVRGAGNGVVQTFANTVSTIAKAFNDRTTTTVDGTTHNFANAKGKVRFVMAGHRHADNTEVLNTIPVVETTWMGDGGVPSFDLCLADYDNNKLHMIRVGTGENRTIDI